MRSGKQCLTFSPKSVCVKIFGQSFSQISSSWPAFGLHGPSSEERDQCLSPSRAKGVRVKIAHYVQILH